MKFPLGDILRAFNPKGWLGKILSWTKGSRISIGGHDVLLDRDHVFPRGESPLDSKPHVPGPPRGPHGRPL